MQSGHVKTTRVFRSCTRYLAIRCRLTPWHVWKARMRICKTRSSFHEFYLPITIAVRVQQRDDMSSPVMHIFHRNPGLNMGFPIGSLLSRLIGFVESSMFWCRPQLLVTVARHWRQQNKLLIFFMNYNHYDGVFLDFVRQTYVRLSIFRWEQNIFAEIIGK